MTETKWETYKKKIYGDTLWVKFFAEIQDTTTGVVVKYIEEGCFDELNGKPYTYIWEDGNFSSGCNRFWFFFDNHSDKVAVEKEETDEVCDSRFIVRLSNIDSGEVFYDEFKQNGVIE